MFESFKAEKPNQAEPPLSFMETKVVSLIGKRFGEHSGENELAFHNAEHTKSVMRRTESILRAIKKVTLYRVTEKDIKLARLVAAFHDAVQESKEQDKDGRLMRQRATGINEEKSADEAIDFLDQEMKYSEETEFSEEDFGVVKEAINGTVPGFDVEKKTVIQPNVTESSSLIARALALADLGTAGMDGAEAFLREGDALFLEENLDIMRALRNEQELSDEMKEVYRKRIIEWSKFQPTFAAGRRDLLDEELRGMPPGADVAIKKLFNKFDESISAAEKRAKERETMSFDELVVDMGFSEQKPMSH